jgi:hypothetical protein
MKKIAKHQTKNNQKFLLYHSLYLLIRSDSEMLSWPNNNPLLVLLHFVDPNVLSGGEERLTPLNHLAALTDPFDYSTHTNTAHPSKTACWTRCQHQRCFDPTRRDVLALCMLLFQRDQPRLR